MHEPSQVGRLIRPLPDPTPNTGRPWGGRSSHRFLYGTALFVLVLLAPVGAMPGLAFTITSPAPDAVLAAGQPVAVVVTVDDQAGMERVEYYWYRQGEEPQGGHQATPALVATTTATPPYGGTLPVPATALGTMRLLAIGHVVKGRLGKTEEQFDEILVQVAPPAELDRIEFEVEKPWYLETIGEILHVPVVGMFADGVTRPLDGTSTGSVYASSTPSVLQVLEDGLVRVAGPGRATLTVTNRGRQGILDVVVRAHLEANQPPVARVESDLVVKAGETVVLSGLKSFDPDGDPLRYEWTQVRGIKVPLLDPNTERATFVAPKVPAKRLLQFQLQVTDMFGPDTVKGADSLPAQVNVWVEP